MKTIYLSLGSNMGDRAENIARAIEAWRARGASHAESSLYETEPVETTEGVVSELRGGSGNGLCRGN